MTIRDFIYGFTFPHECAYKSGHDGDMDFVVTENVPGDDGGATKYGIDASSHPGLNVDALTAEDAESIYIAEFGAVEWSVMDSPSALAEFPGATAFAFFDAREVCGQHEAWLFTQRALGLNDDGIPGKMTRAAVIAAPDRTLAHEINEERRKYFNTLARTHPHDAQFLRGWLNRCDDLETFLFT